MNTAQFVDISAFQPTQIDWKAYRAWAASFDGVARVAMRASYGVGYQDVHFAAYRAGALAAGVDCIFYYHYAYPEYSASAEAEADWMQQVVGAIREQDKLVLDFEEETPAATAAWAAAFLARIEQLSGKVPALYASPAYIAAHLQDARLARYPLWLADWQYNPTERPACPAPWTHYTYLQYTDKATAIPGISASVDADVFLGEDSVMITINSPGVADYFSEVAPDRWHCKQTGKDVAYAMLTYYQTTGGLESLGLPMSNEVGIELVGNGRFARAYQGHAVTVQYFERGVLCYDPQHVIDTPPGSSGPVYRLHLYNGGPGTDPMVWQLQDQLTAAHADTSVPVLQARLAQIADQAAQIEATAKAPIQ